MEKKLIISARTLSILFTPFYWPLISVVALYMFSSMQMMPTTFKVKVCAIVYFFSILLPTFIIRLYHRYNGWGLFQKTQKERRMVPYIVSITSYFACYYILVSEKVPHHLSIVMVVSIILQIFCATINVWWKISTHTAALGGATAMIHFFSMYFVVNLFWWIVIIILLSGLVATSRLILRQHNLKQVLAGYALGYALTFVTLVYSYITAFI